jgi:hypothetical protein
VFEKVNILTTISCIRYVGLCKLAKLSFHYQKSSAILGATIASLPSSSLRDQVIKEAFTQRYKLIVLISASHSYCVLKKT